MVYPPFCYPSSLNVLIGNDQMWDPATWLSPSFHIYRASSSLVSSLDVNSRTRANMDIWTAILRPCYGRAKALIRVGADLTVVGPAGDTPLRLASRLGPADMVRLLLKAGAGPNSDPGFPLNAACANGRLSSVKALLKAGANVNRIHPLTSTPLMYAVLKQHSDIVSLLRRNGADINATNAGGRSALHQAASLDLPLEIFFLTLHGADL